MALTAVMARLRPFAFPIVTGGLCSRVVMFFLFEVPPTTRHSRYSPDDENYGKDGKNDHVEDDSVHHSLSYQVPTPLGASIPDHLYNAGWKAVIGRGRPALRGWHRRSCLNNRHKARAHLGRSIVWRRTATRWCGR